MTKNLLFYLYPIGTYWQYHAEKLSSYWHLFDGKKTIVVAEDEHTAPFEEVAASLPDDINFLLRENNSAFGESAHLGLLLSDVSTPDDEDSITLYAHGKGVTWAIGAREGEEQALKYLPAVKLWVEALYHLNFDHVEECEKILSRFPLCGSFKRLGAFDHFPKGPSGTSSWHYSGNFFWFRNKDLFSRKWKKVPKEHYGAEGYLGTLFAPHEAGTLFSPEYPPDRMLYDLAFLKDALSKHQCEKFPSGIK